MTFDAVSCSEPRRHSWGRTRTGYWNNLPKGASYNYLHGDPGGGYGLNKDTWWMHRGSWTNADKATNFGHAYNTAARHTQAWARELVGGIPKELLDKCKEK